MLWLSEIMLEHHQMNTFEELKKQVRESAKLGERFFRMDVKPSYLDTPNNWEGQLEAVFTSALDE